MLKRFFLFYCIILISYSVHGQTDVLSSNDIDLYKTIFQLNQQGKIKEAQNKEKSIKNPLLKGYLLYDRYYNPKYKTSKTEISDWMKAYSDYPVATEVYALGKQKKISKLSRPKGLFGGNTNACDSNSRVEPLDLIQNISFSYLNK